MPEREAQAEVRAWLRYYRDLGFTHLYRRGAASEAASGAFPGGSAQVSGPVFPETPAPPSGDTGALPSVKQEGLFMAVTPCETLDRIREDLGDCRRCKLSGGRNTIVFGSGNPKAELLFVGEGPGADEDEQGLPFVGRAGQLLTEMIEKGMKIPRPQVYICNIVKCRPPGNRKPERDEIAACRPFVERQIDSVQPRVICALGSTAAETLLETRQSMGSLRGRWYEFRGIPLIVTYHPAFLLRDPNRKGEAWADLKMILAKLREPAPAHSSGRK